MKKKNVFILGDSYSTYAGYIPQGYNTYYGDARKDDPIVKGVEKTWWNRLARENDLNIVLNDSFSGSTVCNTVREYLSVDTSFISRMDKYLAENFFAEHEIGTMFIFGGTNDSWSYAPIGELKYADWTAEELKCVLPAFCYLIHRAKAAVEKVIVIVNTGLKEEITRGVIEACTHNNVTCLCLADIDKVHGHPTELGMEQITRQVAECLKQN